LPSGKVFLIGINQAMINPAIGLFAVEAVRVGDEI
jgi:hypothetical protein